MRLGKMARTISCVALAALLALPAYAGRGGGNGGKNGGGRKGAKTSSQYRDRVCSNLSGNCGYVSGARNGSPAATPTKTESGKQARDGSCETGLPTPSLD